MLAEQMEVSRDERILKGYSLEDLEFETLSAFRNLFSSYKPGHPWLTLDNHNFLLQMGGWRMDRETLEDGLTIAGLLMFGRHRAIKEALPFYFLDYQEHPQDTSETRWTDRLVPDGTWSGNLFDFYRKVIQKLESDLKTPFSLKDNIRQDDTLLHQAMREALINCLVHADYSDRASVKIVKSAKGFTFRNPGLMRVPAEIALDGGESDCRNRVLHSMFLLLGLGEQAGSGIAKIRQGWTSFGHALEIADFHEPYLYTLVQLLWRQTNTTSITTPITNKIQKAVLDILDQNPQITQKGIADILGNVSVEGVKYHLNILKSEGLVKRVGSNRSGHWLVVAKTQMDDHPQ